ncbi:MAG: cytochrome c oxidase subunit 3 [Flavobacteriales bacterium]|jgi:cytochrome c oxidase subunit 3
MTTLEMKVDQQNKETAFRDVSPEIRERTKKMMMYFIIFAVVMLFAGFTSGYIVMAAGEYMVHVAPTAELYYSIVAVIASSITIFLSLFLMKKGNVGGSTLMLGLTLILGITFTITQYQGWQALSANGMGFTIQTAENGQDIYSWNRIEEIDAEYGVDYYVHKDGQIAQLVDGIFFAADDTVLASPITHIIGKQSNLTSSFLAVLIFVHLIHLTFGLMYIAANLFRIIKKKINPKDTVRLHVNGMYWHFMGLLWIYLFVFLFIIH